MFTTSVGLFVQSMLLHIFVPLLPGLLFLWVFYGTRFRGWLLYLFAWFAGVGIVGFSLFLLQFIHFGIGLGEYLSLLCVLFVILIAWIVFTKQKARDYLSSLHLSLSGSAYVQSYHRLVSIQKVLFRIMSVFVLRYTVTGLVHTVSVPTYADDSFGNRHKPVVNILHDGGVHIRGEEDKILARGRLGYPIQIPVYNALISDFMGGYNDVYIGLWQRFAFLFTIIFICHTVYHKTKNIFLVVLGPALICCLPLVYFHVIEGYMDLPSALYAVLVVYALWQFLQIREYAWVSLAVLFASILAYIKNDGFVVYVPGIVIGFFTILFVSKQFFAFRYHWKNNLKQLWISLFYVLWFVVPFLFVKSYYNLGFNQAAGAESGVGLSQTVHREIFRVFPTVFTGMDNYNVSLIFVALCLVWLYRYHRKNRSLWFLFLAPLCIFVVLVLVFLLTDNYTFALNQTTINRVFTMCFVILFAFMGYVFAVDEKTSA